MTRLRLPRWREGRVLWLAYYGEQIADPREVRGALAWSAKWAAAYAQAQRALPLMGHA